MMQAGGRLAVGRSIACAGGTPGNQGECSDLED